MYKKRILQGLIVGVFAMGLYAESTKNEVVKEVTVTVSVSDEESKPPVAGMAKMLCNSIKDYDLLIEAGTKVTFEENEVEATQLATEPTYKKLEEIYVAKDMYLGETTGLSKEDFVDLLAGLEYNNNGFYERNADFIWEVCQEFKFNEIAICGCFAQESRWAKDEYCILINNYSGYKLKSGDLAIFETEQECIRETVRLLVEEYLTPGGKHYVEEGDLVAIGPIYCTSDSDWADEVYKCMQMILQNR